MSFCIFADPFYLSTSRSTASTEASVEAVIGAVVAVLVLLVLNAFLILFCIKRKTGNKSSSASLSSSSGKTTAASTSEGKNHIKNGAGGFSSSLFSLIPSHLNFSLICQNVCFQAAVPQPRPNQPPSRCTSAAARVTTTPCLAKP